MLFFYLQDVMQHSFNAGVRAGGNRPLCWSLFSDHTPGKVTTKEVIEVAGERHERRGKETQEWL